MSTIVEIESYRLKQLSHAGVLSIWPNLLIIYINTEFYDYCWQLFFLRVYHTTHTHSHKWPRNPYQTNLLSLVLIVFIYYIRPNLNSICLFLYLGFVYSQINFQDIFFPPKIFVDIVGSCTKQNNKKTKKIIFELSFIRIE